MLSEKFLISISFISGVISAEYLLKPESRNFLQELISIFLLISISFFIFKNTYYICKEAIIPYSFFVGFASTSLSRILTLSFGFHKKREKTEKEKKYLKAFVRFVYELKKEGLKDEEILKICKKVGINLRIAKKVLKLL